MAPLVSGGVHEQLLFTPSNDRLGLGVFNVTAEVWMTGSRCASAPLASCSGENTGEDIAGTRHLQAPGPVSRARVSVTLASPRTHWRGRLQDAISAGPFPTPKRLFGRSSTPGNREGQLQH